MALGFPNHDTFTGIKKRNTQQFQHESVRNDTTFEVEATQITTLKEYLKDQDKGSFAKFHQLFFV